MFLVWKLYFIASFVSTSPLSFTWSSIFCVAFNRFWEAWFMLTPIKILLLLRVVRRRRVGALAWRSQQLLYFRLNHLQPKMALIRTGVDKIEQMRYNQSLGWWVKSHIYMILLLFYSIPKKFQWSVRKRWTLPPQTIFAAWLLCIEAKGFCDFSKGIEGYMRRCHGSHSSPLTAGKLIVMQLGLSWRMAARCSRAIRCPLSATGAPLISHVHMRSTPPPPPPTCKSASQDNKRRELLTASSFCFQG